MRKPIRGVIAAVCALAMAGVFALAGCAASEQPKGEEQPSTEGQASEAQKDATIELQVFAANSLSKALEEVQQLYMQDHEGVSFKDTQYLSSGELNEQLAGGAYADILISASKGKMDDAVDAGYVSPDTRFDMFKNDLVMVVGENSELAGKDITLDDVASGNYTIGIGDDSVPAGNYANQALSTVGCYTDASGKIGNEITGAGGSYDTMPLAGKVSLQSSVGNVCKQVESGAVDIVFVYSSDVYRFGGVKVVGKVAADLHKNIVYPAALCQDSQQSEAAQEFLAWASADAGAKKLWQEWGFELIAG